MYFEGTKLGRRIVVAGIATLALFALREAAAQPASLTPLDQAPPTNLNSRGYVEGFAVEGGVAFGYVNKYLPNNTYLGHWGTRWTSDGTATEFQPLGTNSAGYTDMHMRGSTPDGAFVIGYAIKFDGSGVDLGFRGGVWDASGNLVAELPSLGTTASGYGSSAANAVSPAGVVVGYSEKYVGGDYRGYRPVRWTAFPPTMQELPGLPHPDGYGYGVAEFVSADGTKAFGVCELYDAVNGDSDGSRACFWNAAGALTVMQTTGTDSDGDSHADPELLAPSGAFAIGRQQHYDGAGSHIGYRTVRWNPDGTTVSFQTLGTTSAGYAESYPRLLSSDEQSVIGYAPRYVGGVDRGRAAVRWAPNGTATELPSLGVRADGYAYGVPNAYASGADAIVGVSQLYDGAGVYVGDRACLWTPDNQIQNLGTLDDLPGHSYAYCVSADARFAFGRSTTNRLGGEACVWIDGEPRQLYDLLVNDHGVDLDGWYSLDQIERCSTDGLVVTGSGNFRGAGRQFIARIPLRNNEPTMLAEVADGGTYEVRAGATFQALFTGEDVDADDELTVTVDGLPIGASFTPSSGTTGEAPLEATLSWTPRTYDFDTSHEMTVTYKDRANRPVSVSFTLVVPPNATPTVDAPEAVVVECDGGQNLVTLETEVSDLETTQALTVLWKVNGTIRKSEQGVAPGSTVDFEWSYADGVSNVTVEVSDSFASASAGTTVTVEDTTAPSIAVAADVVVGTDSGEAFATIPSLPEPTVDDLCDGDPTLTNDSTGVFELGETIVTWTAVDADGNESTATQKVIVEDREAPLLVGRARLQSLCDYGQIFATIELTPPDVVDNVTEDVALEGEVPTIFPVGVTEVTWTARDEAGNESSFTTTVTVINRDPIARTGSKSVWTTSERGLRVSLSAANSSDLDGQPLKYLWTAGDLKIAGFKRMEASCLFPVGSTRATLTVTDPLGATSTKHFRVLVRLRNSRERAKGRAANASLAQALESGRAATSQAAASDQRALGNVYAAEATQLGLLAGDFVIWEEGGSEADATAEYAELRRLQRNYGAAATEAYLRSYLATGSEGDLEAGLRALDGAAYAQADLSER